MLSSHITEIYFFGTSLCSLRGFDNERILIVVIGLPQWTVGATPSTSPLTPYPWPQHIPADKWFPDVAIILYPKSLGLISNHQSGGTGHRFANRYVRRMITAFFFVSGIGPHAHNGPKQPAMYGSSRAHRLLWHPPAIRKSRLNPPVRDEVFGLCFALALVVLVIRWTPTKRPSSISFTSTLRRDPKTAMRLGPLFDAQGYHI